MFRVVLFAFSLIFLMTSGAAQAQESVRVRAGDHDEYARLVFDWGKRVNYTVQPGTNQLVINFNTNATLDDSAFKSDPPKNISGLKVLSTAPLQVAISLKEGATTRDFSAQNRVIVDVYDPPNMPKTEEAKKPEPVKEATKEPVKEPVKETPKPEPKTPEPKVVEQKAEPKPAPATTPPATATPLQTAKGQQPTAPAPVVPAAPQAVSAADLQKLQQEAATDVKTGLPAKPNIIQLTATKSTGMAVFERAGKIWMVTDQEDLLLNPTVTGPNASQMMPPGITEVEGGKVFAFKKIGGKGVQGQAGGLNWRIVVAPHDIHLESVQPTREDFNGADLGGGKLTWDLHEPGRLLEVPDPISGKKLKVVTVNMAKYMSGKPTDYIEFETLGTPVGLTILPKVDDLTVEVTRTGVVVTRPGGLHFMPDSVTKNVRSLRTAQNPKAMPSLIPQKRIFDFNTWQMGGLQILERNRTLVLASLGGKPEHEKVEGLLSLARMHLANGLWAEAAGFLDFAGEELPELESNAEFIGLRGATRALGRVSDLAFEDLNEKQLQDFPEIGYWKAYTLANLEDWQQAGEVLPKDIETLAYYPENLIARLGLVLSEVALRSGHLDEGERILKLVQEHGGKLVFQQLAALDYLKGEAARQRGKPEEALKLWTPLTTGKDTMYRARAGLAITRLQYEKKQITPVQAIDKLERLRYAWRGDELEALINYWLGKVYFDTGDYIKGLNIMRDGATFSEGTDLSERITAEMSETFVKLFSSDDLQKLSGPDAAALYDEFGSLIPEGDKGHEIAERLADHLVSKELFERAIALLDLQMTHRQGAEAFRIATKLAAIELLDKKSVNALSTLSKGREILESLPEDQRTPERYQELALLRARALSQERRPDQALALLQDLPRSKAVNNLRADIAWRAGYWDDAAAALGDVIMDEDISLTRPLTPEHTNLLMQRAVALSLSSDRIGLANMREKYSDVMAQTDKARIFEVITRPRQSGALADRETLMGIVSEVDLFKEFLDSYKTQHAPPAPATPAIAPGDPATTPSAPTPASAAPAATPPASN